MIQSCGEKCSKKEWSISVFAMLCKKANITAETKKLGAMYFITKAMCEKTNEVQGHCRHCIIKGLSNPQF